MTQAAMRTSSEEGTMSSGGGRGEVQGPPPRTPLHKLKEVMDLPPILGGGRQPYFPETMKKVVRYVENTGNSNLDRRASLDKVFPPS